MYRTLLASGHEERDGQGRRIAGKVSRNARDWADMLVVVAGVRIL
jgi:hypothetical protein